MIRKQPLNHPFSVIITESLARKYFGEEDAFGRELIITRYFNTDEEVFKITGIMKDLPSHTHMPMEMLVSFRNEEERSGWAYSYMLTNEEADIKSLTKKIEELLVKNEGEKSLEGTEYVLQPLSEIHLHSNLAREIQPNGNILYIRVIFWIGIFILLIAMINFMNLNSVISLSRAKEIGLRKVMGSDHKQLLVYSLVESTMLSLIAALIGCALVMIVFPFLKEAIGIENLLSIGSIVIAMVGLSLITGIFSGFYPTFVLSSLAPLNVLKSSRNISLAKGSNHFSFRKILVTSQFAICILLIGTAFIARQQFKYLNEKNLGLKKEQVLAVTAVPDVVKDKFKSFKDELLTKSGILGVSACLEVPSREIRDGGNVEYDGMTGVKEDAPSMDIQVIDHDFIEVMGLELLAGEPLAKSLDYEPIPAFEGQESIQAYLKSNSREYIINETAMKKMGWKQPEEAVGKNISFSNFSFELQRGPIVGVVRNFHQETLKNKVDPVVMLFEPVWLSTFLVKLSTGQIRNSVIEIEETWNQMFPQYPFEYVFVDELYEKLYKSENQQLQLLYALSGLAILIAFLGLFGLVAYSLKTRTKEIAVRKVFGADVVRLIGLLSKEYLGVVVIAAIIAIPISYYIIVRWLENYAYRINISLGNYLLTLILILIILLGTITFHTFRSTRINPIDSLREH